MVRLGVDGLAPAIIFVVPDLDLVLAPELALEDLLGVQLHLLDAVATRETPPLMFLHASKGRAVSIGRYHLYCGPRDRAGVSITRRLTGGRIVGAGDGWLGLALILPTRTALLKEDAARLKPDQIMNRYVRGLLSGLRKLGLECFYPGRDAITFEQREIAMCTFETNASGAMLFEVAIAQNRGMEEVVRDLEHLDPDGALSCRMYDAVSATTLARELRRNVSFDEIADAILSGYTSSLSITQPRELTEVEIAYAGQRARSLATSNWLGRDTSGTAKPLRNRIASQLGAIDAAVALDAEGSIEAARIGGDFIANSPAVAQLETELRGRRLDLASISQAVTKIFSREQNFLLGAGDLTNLIRLIVDVN